MDSDDGRLTEDECDSSDGVRLRQSSFHPLNTNWRHFEGYHNEDGAAIISTDASVDKNYIDYDSGNEDGGVFADAEDVSTWTSAGNFSGPDTGQCPKYALQSMPRGSLPIIMSGQDVRLTTPSTVCYTKPPKPPFNRHHKAQSLDEQLFPRSVQPISRNSLDEAVVSGTPSTERSLLRRLNRVHTQSTSDLRFPSVERSSCASDASVSVKQRTQSVRSQYNAQIMPHKVVLIRHGQSMGNIDERFYSTTPDNAMPLTQLGWAQAREAGKHLRERVLQHPDRVHFIVSPYVRTVETFHGIVSAWCDPDEFSHIRDRKQRLKAWYGRLQEMGLTWREDPRIREQDFGNYQKPEEVKRCKRERAEFGAFFYRFPHGESASDVFDRISTFLDSLWRSFDMNRSQHYVLVTHGIAIRVLLTRYFRYTVDQFHLLANPRNCEMIVLGHDNCGRLELFGRHELVLGEEEGPNGEREIRGYAEHRRLRVLPESYVRRVKVRISQNDHE